MTRTDDPAHFELTAIADDSLSGRRRRKLDERLASEPELRAELERQQLAVAAVRSVDLAAPASLRAFVQTERTHARGPARRRRVALGGGLAGAAAAGTLALVLALPSGAGAPTVVEAAELAERSPTASAPRPGRPALLAVSAFGLPFPDWGDFGWTATGLRSDEIDGRDAITVFYEKNRRRIAYTIVSGERMDLPGGAASTARDGTALHYFADRDRLVVTWERGGLTCILSGRGVASDVLLDLAAWRAQGKLPS